MKKQFNKQLFIFFLLAWASGLHAQEVGIGYSGTLILDNRISEALPVFGPSETFALDIRISETLPLYGFSDVFSAFTIVSIHLDNTEISPPADTCMQAMQTIILSDVVVQSNASITLAAGENILIQTLTQIESGAYLRAYIDDSWLVCQQMEGMLAASDHIEEDVLEWPLSTSQEQFFSIFPNPTTAKFTLEIPIATSTIMVEIYSMMGGLLLKQEVSGFTFYEFDLSAQPRGLYILRASDGEKTGTQRIIRQ